MKKALGLTFVLSLAITGVLWAAGINLTTPTTKPSYSETVRVTYIGLDINDKSFKIRLSFGYWDAGTWVETKVDLKRVVNIPGVADNPDTPENEYVPAKLAYDNLLKAFRTMGPTDTEEKIILRGSLKEHPGTIVE